MTTPSPFKWRHFEPDIILCGVRWYLRYSLSYRDVEELMQDRGLSVDHTTVFRWVQRYAPELDKRVRPHLKSTNDSYCVDETYGVGEYRNSYQRPSITAPLLLTTLPQITSCNTTIHATAPQDLILGVRTR